MPTVAGELRVIDMTVAHVIALLTAGMACVSDLRSRRIPNLLTFGAAAAGVLFHGVTGGAGSGLTSVGGVVVGIALLVAVYLVGGLGAGDVKLVGALGAWFGPMDTVWLVLYTGVAGGVLAIAVAARHSYLRQALRNIGLLLAYWRLAGIRPMGGLTLQTAGGPRLPYATSILAGTAATIWLR
jgi:prepilin peptidase CpaA